MQDKSIIFYDGHCGLCHGLVKFVLKRDSKEDFYFSPLGGDSFNQLAEPEILSRLPDSFFVVDHEGRIHLKAFGLKVILDKLGGSYGALNILLAFFPWRLRNYCYDLVASIRYRIFGNKEETCPVLSPELSRRFLA